MKIDKEFYVGNRKKFADLMENGSAFVICSGAAPVMRGDRFYDYSPQRNFLYLTGIDKPGLALMITKNIKGDVISRIYLQRYDEVAAKWGGAPLLPEKAKELSGIEHTAYIDELELEGDGRTLGIATAFVRGRAKTLYLDLENRSLTAANTPELDLAKRVREKFPAVTIVDAHPILGGLRLVKEAAEIPMLQKAVDVTGEGFLALLDNAKPGMAEYELEAHLDYVFRKNNCRKGFSVIMAAGINGTVLHYHDNNCKIEDGDLVLVDYGADFGWYSADITRTFPINGKFTDRQKQLYNIVLEAGKRVIAMIKPGVKFSALNEAVKDYYAEELAKIGLIKEKEEVGKYYYHGVSHMLGLEVHDVGAGSTSTDGELMIVPGMYITVEPGLYVADEKIGIRIEDDVLVTADGNMVLSKNIIKEVDEIESYMAKRA
ncbi:MAG: aminopeptidase P family protein [Defluviitaleaceae bacterium]|nr:aminopeptidase P family protein [Defluviitaleaceae bacterium]